MAKQQKRRYWTSLAVMEMIVNSTKYHTPVTMIKVKIQRRKGRMEKNRIGLKIGAA